MRGYTWTVVPITWRNRRTGVAKLKIRGDGQPLFFHLHVRLAGKVFQPGRLQTSRSAPGIDGLICDE